MQQKHRYHHTSFNFELQYEQKQERYLNKSYCGRVYQDLGKLSEHLKLSFQWLGTAATISMLATKFLEILGDNLINYSSFIGKHHLIEGSAFLTGALAFAFFEIGVHLGGCLSGENYVWLTSALCGTATTILFAYLASVPVITCLAFAAFGAISKNCLSNKPFAYQKTYYKNESYTNSTERLKKLKAQTWPEFGAHLLTCAAAGGLIYDIGTKLISSLEGIDSSNLGFDNAAYASSAWAVTAVVVDLFSHLIVEKIALIFNTQPTTAHNAGVTAAFVLGTATGLITIYSFSPVSITVHLIMLSSSIGTYWVTK